MSNSTSNTNRKPIGTTAKTGENCPEGGTWEVENKSGASLQNAKTSSHETGKSSMEDSQKNSGDSQKNSGDSQKNSGDSQKHPSDSQRNSGDVQKNSGDSQKNSGDSQKNSGDSHKSVGEAHKGSDDFKSSASPATLTKGTPMPAYDGKPATWKLTKLD